MFLCDISFFNKKGLRNTTGTATKDIFLYLANKLFDIGEQAVNKSEEMKETIKFKIMYSDLGVKEISFLDYESKMLTY